jgi:hypothetical protein
MKKILNMSVAQLWRNVTHPCCQRWKLNRLRTFWKWYETAVYSSSLRVQIHGLLFSFQKKHFCSWPFLSMMQRLGGTHILPSHPAQLRSQLPLIGFLLFVSGTFSLKTQCLLNIFFRYTVQEVWTVTFLHWDMENVSRMDIWELYT